MTKKIYLLDVAGYLFRSYYALPRMTNLKGESTHALYGFIRSILKVFKDFEPEYVAAVFDGPHNKRQRTEIFADYKSKRVAAPEDLPHQMAWAQDFCRIYGIPQLSIEGVEADDTIGSITKWIVEHGFEVYLCSGDKDLCQLVSENVWVLQTHKDNLLLDASRVEELYGVPPNLITDYLALVGDQSDNIPGVAGIGPKTAVALLKEFGSLENLLANATHVAGKKRQEILLQEADIALLSKRLAVIDCNVKIPLNEEFFELQAPSNKELMDFYGYMNFNALIKEIPQDMTEQNQTLQSAEQLILQAQYELVDTEDALMHLNEQLQNAPEVCFYTETTSLNPFLSKLVGIGFAISKAQCWYIPANGQLGRDRLISFLKMIFCNKKIGFITHDAKFELHVLRRCGIKISNLIFDTMLGSYLLHSHTHRHSLEHLALLHLGYTKLPVKNLVEKSGNMTMEDLPVEEVKDYCCLDVDLILQLKIKLKDELEERHLLKLMHTLELPLIHVLAEMEHRGIYVDLPYLRAMSQEVGLLIEAYEKEIYQLAGEEFNLNSPKQLSQILYEKLEIKSLKKTATGQASTNADVLEALASQYPIAAKLLEYRTIEKLRTTYINKLPDEINPHTHRIHCTFNQTVAATGRLSCQDPNLQNIPIRTEVGRRIREAFKPQKEGWSYLAADYSQIELRILAHLSEDPQLMQAFLNNEDIHAYTASLILNVPLGEVTKEQRHQAKAVNFGIVYGQQAFGLSQELGIGMKEAAAFIEAYFLRYKRVREFLEECKVQSRRTGKSVTMTGRERSIPDMHSKNPGVRNAAERLAINTPLQGSAADLIKKAMLNVENRLTQEQKLSYMILQIHDELLFEVPDFELIDLQSLVKEEMERVFLLKVPLKVDIAIGKNWKEC